MRTAGQWFDLAFLAGAPAPDPGSQGAAPRLLSPRTRTARRPSRTRLGIPQTPFSREDPDPGVGAAHKNHSPLPCDRGRQRHREVRTNRGRDPGALRRGVRSACDSERPTTVTHGQSWSLGDDKHESARSAFALVRALEH